MRAARYEQEGKAADVLVVGGVALPEIEPHEVVVRIAVSGINPSDVKARIGQTPRPIDGFQIPHMDGAGEITAVGADVDPARLGQRVWLRLAALGNRWGTSAEFSVVDQALAVPLPDGASVELGACLGIPALTAHECLFASGPVESKVVLVHGGAGAVGHYAIELARWAGAAVIASASTEEKAEQARAAGAELVVDYRAPGVVEQIKQLGRPVDLIVEVALVDNWELDLAVLATGGTISSYAWDSRPLNIALRQVHVQGVRFKFFLLYTHPREALSRAAERVNEAIVQKALTPLPITPFALEDVVAAHEAVEAGIGGKVVLDLRAQDAHS